MRYAVVPVPKQAPSYLPGLASMATTPGRRRLSRHIEQPRAFARPDQIADHPTNEPANVITQQHGPILNQLPVR
jgi:hypothetical protein